MSAASIMSSVRTVRAIWPCRLLLVGLTALASAGSAGNVAAQNVRNHPGYVDLAALGNLDDVFSAAPTVEVNVEGALLKLVVEASRTDDPELAELLERLEGLFVRVYPASGASDGRIRDRMRLMGTVLAEDGWQTIVSVSERDQFVRMFARSGVEGILGLVVMSLDDEAVFLNIVGDVDPEQIGRIGSRFRVATGTKPR